MLKGKIDKIKKNPNSQELRTKNKGLLFKKVVYGYW